MGAFARAAGSEQGHVRPHGALYNRAVGDAALAATIARAVRSISAELILVGPAGSRIVEAGDAAGLRTAAEAFADRAYEIGGSLRSRRLPGAILPTAAAAAEQAVGIVLDGKVRTFDGDTIALRADTICVHGDT